MTRREEATPSLDPDASATIDLRALVTILDAAKAGEATLAFEIPERGVKITIVLEREETEE